MDKHVQANINRLRENAKKGEEEYGVTLERTDLSTEEWLDHAIEEALDFANYLQRLKEEL